MNDIKYGFRMLRRSPAFTAVAALSLALGIGATTAIFSLVNAILLRPIPMEAPSRLASVLRAVGRRSTGPTAEDPHIC